MAFLRADRGFGQAAVPKCVGKFDPHSFRTDCAVSVQVGPVSVNFSPTAVREDSFHAGVPTEFEDRVPQAEDIICTDFDFRPETPVLNAEPQIRQFGFRNDDCRQFFAACGNSPHFKPVFAGLAIVAADLF